MFTANDRLHLSIQFIIVTLAVTSNILLLVIIYKRYFQYLSLQKLSILEPQQRCAYSRYFSWTMQSSIWFRRSREVSRVPGIFFKSFYPQLASQIYQCARRISKYFHWVVFLIECRVLPPESMWAQFFTLCNCPRFHQFKQFFIISHPGFFF